MATAPKTQPTPTQHAGMMERASFYMKNLAAAFGMDEATVRDLVSGKKISLGRRKKQVESAAQADTSKFGAPIDIP